MITKIKRTTCRKKIIFSIGMLLSPKGIKGGPQRGSALSVGLQRGS
jgi:hypothetical protein